MIRKPQLPSKRIELDLRRRMAAGEWSRGDELPTLIELAAHYHASRETVAKVLRRLANEGLLGVMPRWGTFKT